MCVTVCVLIFVNLKKKIDQSFTGDQCFIDLHEIGKRVFFFPESLSCDEFYACQFGAFCYKRLQERIQVVAFRMHARSS